MGFTSSCSKVAVSKTLPLFWKGLFFFLPFHLLIFCLLRGSVCLLLLHHLYGWPLRGIKQKPPAFKWGEPALIPFPALTTSQKLVLIRSVLPDSNFFSSYCELVPNNTSWLLKKTQTKPPITLGSVVKKLLYQGNKQPRGFCCSCRHADAIQLKIWVLERLMK